MKCSLEENVSPGGSFTYPPLLNLVLLFTAFDGDVLDKASQEVLHEVHTYSPEPAKNTQSPSLL